MFPKTILLKNQETAIIREAMLSDAPNMVNYVHLVAGESDFLSFGVGDWDVSIAEEEQHIRTHQEHPNQIFLLVIHQNQIAAMLNVVGGKRPRTQHSVEFGVSVLKKFWRLGIGRQLIQAMLDWCIANPIIQKVNLRASQNNTNALKLYEQLGFEYEGRIRQDFKINGKLIDTYCMGKIL